MASWKTKDLLPFVRYARGYGPGRELPPLKKFASTRGKRLRNGVRSCDSRRRADKGARELLREFVTECKRRNPELKLVRSGWETGKHRWANEKNDWPDNRRWCKCSITTRFYAHFTPR